ncbi:hypothetical protein M2232_009258 [Bradyrhizobium japonicum]|nr:hypothetical protein [Bradyrhizobium japonicum]MCW2340938.1 hypothetical protein [Bradyrhizobium japonicum]
MRPVPSRDCRVSMSAPLIRPCLRNFSFWSDACFLPHIAADAIASTYDAVEDGGGLFVIAVRCSGSFARRDGWRTHRKAYARPPLAILFMPGARYSALRSPYPNPRWSTVEIGRSTRRFSQRDLHMFKSHQHRARAPASGELVKSSTSAEESRKFKTWRAGFALLTENRRKNEVGRNKLPLARDRPSDARSGAAALSRWENEGGSVLDELPM